MNKNLLIIGAESIVNHCSMYCDSVDLECDAVVADNTLVLAGTFIDNDMVYKRNTIYVNDLFFDADQWHEELEQLKNPHESMPINGKEYCFEDRI